MSSGHQGYLIKDDAPWYDHRMVSLRRQRRKAEREWRRLRTDSSRTVYVAGRRAVVKQIFVCKVEYYQHQLALTAGDHRRTFQLLNDLLGKVQCPTMPSSSSEVELAARFSAFFNAKIDRIRSEIDVSVAGHEFSVDISFDLDIASTFSYFRPINETDVLRYMRETKKTCCPLDSINVLKLGPVYERAAPVVVAIINSSFTEGSFSVSEKRGLVRPYLKKVGLDAEDLANYRPVTNLSYLSKIEECAMLEQLVPFLEEAGLIPHCQSAYRRFHSTETVLCKIYNDLVHTICLGRSSLLVLLDLSAAFDTVDQQLLLNDFYNSGMRDVALDLLKSYISEREQRVVVGETQSEPTFLHCGVPQGSVLGLLLFTVYTSSLVNVLVAHGVDYHFYADDSQLYIQIDNIPNAKERLTLLMSDVKIWMARRRLKLNEGKTEIIIVRGNLRNDLRADFGMLHFDNIQLVPGECARDLWCCS